MAFYPQEGSASFRWQTLRNLLIKDKTRESWTEEEEEEKSGVCTYIGSGRGKGGYDGGREGGVRGGYCTI
jgi:hypothetical protein